MIGSEQCMAHGKTSVNVSLLCEDLCSDWGAQQGIRSSRVGRSRHMYIASILMKDADPLNPVILISWINQEKSSFFVQ